MRRALIRLTNDSFGEEVIRVTEACHCQQRGARARTRASAEHTRAGSTNITAADDVVTDHESAADRDSHRDDRSPGLDHESNRRHELAACVDDADLGSDADTDDAEQSHQPA